MDEIKSCPYCGSTQLEPYYLNTAPAIHCKDCNFLMTRVTKEELSEIIDDLSDSIDVDR